MTDPDRRGEQFADEVLHCPKCGVQKRGPYALLGHIYTHHWIVDEGEVGGDE